MPDEDWLEPYYVHEQDFDSLAAAEEWFEWDVPERFNIASYVCDRWADDDPDRIALYQRDPNGDETAYTYADVREYAERFAAFLRDRGIGRGDRVAINGTQRVESLIGNLATFKLGAVSIPLTVLLGTDGLEYRLGDAAPDAFLADPEALDALRSVRDDVPGLDTVVTYGDVAAEDEIDLWTAIDGRAAGLETVSTRSADPAFIIYTSGTTGEPKGVVHAHRHLLGELPQYLSLQCHDTSADQVTRTVAEWSWIMSLPGMVLPALFYGVPVVGYPGGSFDPAAEFELVERYGVTHLNLPPTAVRMMMQVDAPDERWALGSIQSFSTGGESADEGIIEWVHETFPNAAFLEGYGTSEIGGIICDDPALGRDHRIGYFGVPSLGHEIAVLDPESHERIEAPDEIGELAIRYEGDPMLMLEYLNKPERTDDTIRDGWLLSDDLVSRDEDGYVRFHSRSDDLIISSGYRIAPREIEEALLADERVQHAGVIGVPDDTRGEIPKAYLVLAPGVSASEALKAELQDLVKERLAKYEYPREIAFTDELPTTATGKVRRQTLLAWEGIAE